MTIGRRLIRRLVLRAHREERGQVLIFFAMFIVSVGLAMGVVAVDASFWHSERRHVQSAADAAALAAAQDIPTDPGANETVARQKITDTATKYAALDGYDHNADHNVVVSTYWPPSDASPHHGDKQYVEVTIDSPSAGFFVGAFKGLVPPHHGGRAVAKLAASNGGDALPCAMCVLNPSADDALEMEGSNASIAIPGGSIKVDSTAGCDSGDGNNQNGDSGNNNQGGNNQGGNSGGNCDGNCNGNCGNGFAVNIQNNSLSATSIGVVGGWTKGSGGSFNPTPVHISSFTDPLASLTTASLPTGSNLGDRSSGTINQGVYRNLTVSGSNTLTLNPGTYVVTGAMTASGHGTITGSGVTVYFACSHYPTPCATNEDGAGLTVSGNGAVNLTAPTSGPYQGVVIFYDRKNRDSVDIGGNGASLSGTIYAKAAQLKVSGNGSVHGTNSAVVVDRVLVSGNGSIQITASGSGTGSGSTAATLIE